MDLETILFYALAVLTGTCAVGVVVSQNIVRAAAWLLFALSGVAGILFLLNAEFVGSVQLLVYVGGTLVLVVFGVMLTAQGPFISMRIAAAEWAIAAAVGLTLYGVLAVSLARVAVPGARPAEPVASIHLGQALLGDERATPEHYPGTDERINVTGVPPAADGKPRPPIPRTPVAYLLPFEIVSVHLLVVLIGAAYLARAKRRLGRGRAGPTGDGAGPAGPPLPASAVKEPS
jgi:NADH-quinone oxidoreductase subunit J